MAKILYLPFSIISGLLARVIGRSIFRTIWARIDEEKLPKPGQGQSGAVKIIGGKALQSAVMAGSAAAVEQVFAGFFHHILGVWPRKPPKPETD